MCTNDSGMLSNFCFDRVLGENADTKSLAILGHWADAEERPGKVILVLEKTLLSEEHCRNLSNACTSVTVLVDNDVFKTLLVTVMDDSVNQLRATYMYPADEAHVRKYTWKEPVFVEETPAMYQSITRPYICRQSITKLQWIYNILDGTSETEQRLFDDTLTNKETGFVLLPDYKWDQQRSDKLYCLAMVAQRGIACLRDLTDTHLPLLRHIREHVAKAIATNYNVPANKLRLFVHYQPTYYHFHVHVVHTSLFLAGFNASKAHLLADVIDNLTLDGNYYAKRTLCFEMAPDDPLYCLLCK
jgi:m7GpppX diphosphatase